MLACAWASAASAQTFVSLTFDDNIATQNLVRPLLAAHGMHGTFYVNSGNVGANDYYMTWADVDALEADGNEIGGHTVNHVRLTNLTPEEQRQQICDDAAALRARGYSVTDFAYPFGSGSGSSTVRQALADCGYVSARKYGDLYSEGCTDPSCPFAEPVPPPAPYAIRTPEFLPREIVLSDLQTWVTQAEDHGGGWVPIVLHDICDACEDSSVSVAALDAFLDWLEPRAASGTLVRTVREVMGTPPAGYPRPKGATPLRVPLVISSAACTEPNSTHGAPLAFPSCSPPLRSSGQLTIGSPDANGRGANSIGFVLLGVVPGDTGTAEDEADVNIGVSITDVRKASDLEDYTGELEGRWTIRLTDKLNGPSETESATVGDLPFSFAVPCTATAEATIGSTCSLATTADALTPGIVREGARAIWELSQVELWDGGPDGVASTQDNERFAVQGLFVP